MAGTRSRKGKQAVRNNGIPAWLLVVIGIVVGAGVMAWVDHSGHMPVSRNDEATRPTAQSAPQQPATAGIAQQGKTSKPRYDFYSILPEKEVVIPDAQISAQAKAEQQQATTADATGTTAAPTTATGTTGAASANTGDNAAGHYMLQIASFPNSSDAEALKAKLALQGFRADIEPAKINGQTWNRVRLGPYANASQLEAVKDKLAAAGVHAIALKIK